MLQAALKVIGKKHQGKLIPLTAGRFLIGREHDCHLRPNSELVSRHHCVFTADSFTVRLRDLGSTNGTFVNNKRIRGEVTLKAGDRVQVGRLIFETILNGVEGSHADIDPAALSKGSSDTAQVSGSSMETMSELPIPQTSAGADPSDVPPEPAVGDSGTFVLSPQIEAAAEEQMAAQAEEQEQTDAAVDDTQVASHTSIVLNPTEEQVAVPVAETTPLPPNAGAAPGQDPYQQQPQPQFPGQQPPQYAPQQPMMPGYPPQMPYAQQYPGYPYPQQVMGGYPQQPMPYMAPGAGYPQQQAVYHPPTPAEVPAAAADDDDSDGGMNNVAVPPVQLPDPSQTGAKAPEPKPEPTGEEQAAAAASKKDDPSALAADMIKQQLQRRPGS